VVEEFNFFIIFKDEFNIYKELILIRSIKNRIFHIAREVNQAKKEKKGEY
jgi:hypothetical protein